MGAAHLRVIDFDGFDLDPESAPATCDACFLVDFDITAQFSLEAVKASAPANFPDFIRGDPQDRVIPLHITVREAATPALTLDRINELKEVFSPFRDSAYLRVVDENGITRRMLVKSLGLAPWEEHSSRAYVASLDADEPIWEADAAVDTSPIISGSAAGGYVFTVENEGNVRTYPEIRLAAFRAKGLAADFVRRWDVLVVWRSPLQGVDSQGLPYPIDIFDRSWNTAVEIGAGWMQADGDDIRVFVDQVEVDRYLDDINTTGTAVWCSIAFEPVRVATIVNMPGVADPATGTDLEVTNPEGTTGFPDVGVLLIENEAVAYRGRSPTAFLNIHRMWRHTTGVAHAVGTPAYFVEHEIVVMTNYSAYASPLARDDREPIIDLAASDNRKHVYGADGFYEASTLRPGQWLRELRGTEIGAAVTAMSQTAGEVTITDAAPTADAPNFDALSLYAPCFVSPLATGVEMDYEIDHDMLLDILAIDAQGFEQLLLRRDIRPVTGLDDDYYAGAPAYQNGVTYLPADRLSRLSLHAWNYRLTGVVARTAVPDQYVGVGDADNEQAESFKLAAAAQIRAAHFVANKTAGSTRDLSVLFKVFRSGIPETYQLGAHIIPHAAYPVGGIYDTGADITVFYVGDEPISVLGQLPSDKYAVVWREYTGAGFVRICQAYDPLGWTSIYSGGERWIEVATAWTEYPGFDFKACLCGLGTQQPDAEVGSGATVKVRNVDVHLHPDYVPAFSVGTPQAAYFWQATLENQTTGQLLTFFAPHEFFAAFVAIRAYMDEHRVEAQPLAGGPLQSRPTYMEPSDIADWLHLNPGLNTLVYTEPSIGVGLIQLFVVHRNRWT